MGIFTYLNLSIYRKVFTHEVILPVTQIPLLKTVVHLNMLNIGVNLYLLNFTSIFSETEMRAFLIIYGNFSCITKAEMDITIYSVKINHQVTMAQVLIL